MSTPALCRATIARLVELPPAPGVVSRRLVAVSLHPAEIGQGIRFRRSDLGVDIPADTDHLAPARNCTAVGEGGASVAFIEHLMACLAAARLSDVLVVTDGPEIPLWEGSARLPWQALQEAGRAESDVAWPTLTVREPLCVSSDQASLEAAPAERTLLSYELEHPHPLIGRQRAEFTEDDDFGSTLAPARTFATDEEIRALYGTDPTPEMEQMCLIVYPERLSEERAVPQPFARHKLVDLLGDLFLCGRIVQGRITARRSGHGLNHALARELAAAGGPGQS